MYQNPGGTIKKIGKVLFIIGIVLSVIYGLSIWISGGQIVSQSSNSYSYSYSDSYGRSSSSSGAGFFAIFFAGAFSMALGIFISYIMNVFLVAFGELVENSTLIKNHLLNNNVMTQNNSYQPKAEPPKPKQCPICGTINDPDRFTCDQCGFGLSGSNSTAKPKTVPVSSGFWTCPKCGTENASGTFCGKCGNRKA